MLELAAKFELMMQEFALITTPHREHGMVTFTARNIATVENMRTSNQFCINI
jgi:hypothetical protein